MGHISCDARIVPFLLFSFSLSLLLFSSWFLSPISLPSNLPLSSWLSAPSYFLTLNSLMFSLSLFYIDCNLFTIEMRWTPTKSHTYCQLSDLICHVFSVKFTNNIELIDSTAFVAIIHSFFVCLPLLFFPLQILLVRVNWFSFHWNNSVGRRIKAIV